MAWPRVRAAWRASRFDTFGLAALLVCAGAVARNASLPPAQRVSLTLVSTTDLHGHIYPEDDITGRPAQRGLAKIATLVAEIRAEHTNVILLDCGDTIEGSPLAYVAATKMAARSNPMIAAMNAMDYTAMAVGNHEFNFGLATLEKARREAKFPFLAANLRPVTSLNPLGIESYIIRTVDGVRVGIVGFVTPGVVHWELPENYQGYEFEGIVHAAERVVPVVRAKSDLVVVIMHSGLGRDAATGKATGENSSYEENAANTLAETVPGIDVIFFGHTHLEYSGKTEKGVVLVQAKNWGQSLAEADVVMEHEADGAWRVLEKASRTIPVTEQVTPDAGILALAKPFHDETEKWLGQTVSRATEELGTAEGRLEPNSLLALLNDAQMDAGRADVSFATIFNTRLHVAAGDFTMRDVFALYPYENRLFTVEMTGAQIQEALEHAASFYPQWPAKEQLRLPGYDVDAAAGVNYVLDLTQPVGQRVRELTYRGKAMDPARKFRVAVNHYRYYGGGHYDVYRRLPILYRSKVGIREILADYIEKKVQTIPVQTVANWRIAPPEALEALRATAQR